MPPQLLRRASATPCEQEFLERAIERACREAFAEAKLARRPGRDRGPEVRARPAAAFEAVVEVRPEVEAKDYKGLAGQRRTRAVDDADGRARGRATCARRPAVFDGRRARPQAGDLRAASTTSGSTPTAAADRAPAAKDSTIQLGERGLLPEFENGAARGRGRRERTVEVAYPADYPDPGAGRERPSVPRPGPENPGEESCANWTITWPRRSSGSRPSRSCGPRIRAEPRGRGADAGPRREVEDAAGRGARPAPSRSTLPERWSSARCARGDRASDRAPRRSAPICGKRARASHGTARALERSAAARVLLDAIARQEKLRSPTSEVAAEIERMAAGGPAQVAQEFGRATSRRSGAQRAARRARASARRWTC